MKHRKNQLSPFSLAAAFALLVLIVSLAPGREASAQAPTPKPRRVRSTPTDAPALTLAPAPLNAGEEPANPPPAVSPAAKPEPTTVETEILAMQGATFNSKDRTATFTGDVRVTDPRFQLSCDELTVYLRKAPTPKTDDQTPAPSGQEKDKDKGKGKGDSDSGGGIDRAVAKGHVIMIQERAATGADEAKRSIARADRGDFDNNTGKMVLHGSPIVEQNGNRHVATSPNTVMTLGKDNSLKTEGPSRTLIIQKKDAKDVPNTAKPSPAQPRG